MIFLYGMISRQPILLFAFAKGHLLHTIRNAGHARRPNATIAACLTINCRIAPARNAWQFDSPEVMTEFPVRPFIVEGGRLMVRPAHNEGATVQPSSQQCRTATSQGTTAWWPSRYPVTTGYYCLRRSISAWRRYPPQSSLPRSVQ